MMKIFAEHLFSTAYVQKRVNLSWAAQLLTFQRQVYFKAGP